MKQQQKATRCQQEVPSAPATSVCGGQEVTDTGSRPLTTCSIVINIGIMNRRAYGRHAAPGVTPGGWRPSSVGGGSPEEQVVPENICRNGPYMPPKPPV
ncbi:hypothetical protein JOQ06_015553 [Pogonophryne albipinna]|uniref:Uncharacterized protein n=1 Tax=Pogonophryne albipinna TaxID=1090488 RepID=A0AAD6AMX0_9TELE|nr:hypothetical protein JOQ06_015553 [Pogonophryne albipinna]